MGHRDARAETSASPTRELARDRIRPGNSCALSLPIRLCGTPTEILARIWHRLLVERRPTRIWPNPTTGPRLSVSAGQSLFAGTPPPGKHLGATAFQGGAVAWGCNRALSSVSAGQSPFRWYPRPDSNRRYRLERAMPVRRVRAGQRLFGPLHFRDFGTHMAWLDSMTQQLVRAAGREGQGPAIPAAPGALHLVQRSSARPMLSPENMRYGQGFYEPVDAPNIPDPGQA